MGKDTTAFRERFNDYKNGKPVSEIYDAGLPRYAEGTELPIEQMMPYILAVENPTKQGLVNGVWRPPTDSSKWDTHAIGGGLDIREENNPIVYNYLKSKGRLNNPYLTVSEEEMLRKQTFEKTTLPALRKMYGKYKDKISEKGYARLAGMKWQGHPYLMAITPDSITGKAFLNAVASGDRDLDSVFDAYYKYPANAKRYGARINADVNYWKNYSTSSNVEPKSELVQLLEQLNKEKFLPWSNYHSPDYSLSNPAPSTISSWNNPTSPAFNTSGLYARRTTNNINNVIQDVLLNDKDPLDALIDNISNNVFGGKRLGFKNGKLPGYKDGTPTKVGEYNVYPSAVGASELSVTTPEVVVTGKDRRPLYLRYDAERSVYNSNDIISGLNTLTLGGMNNLSPTQWVRRFYDTPKLFSGDMPFSDYTNKWLNGNEGIVSSEFAQEHPYYSMLFNTIGDGLIGASAVLSARVLNQLRPQNLGKHFYYNVNPQGYDNMIKLAKGIAKTVLKGSEPDIENPIWDTPGAFKVGASEYGVPEDVFRKARIDAWRMHTNIPQKYNTFTPSKRVPGAYTAERDVARMMEPDILEDEYITKMLKLDKGVGVDFFNGSGGNVGFVNYDLGRTLNGDKLGVLVTDDIWDVLPFSRINQGKGLGSRLTEHTTQKILKKILPIKSKVTRKLDDLSYNDDIEGYKKWAAQHPDEVEFIDPREVFSTPRKIKPALDLAIKTINKGTTKVSDFDRWLRKTLNNKAKNFEVGSLYKGSPFRVINEFPYTRALNVNDLGQMNPGAVYSYWGGFDTKNILPTLAHDYHLKGILPVNVGDNIPSQLRYK